MTQIIKKQGFTIKIVFCFWKKKRMGNRLTNLYTYIDRYLSFQKCVPSESIKSKGKWSHIKDMRKVLRQKVRHTYLKAFRGSETSK